MSGAIPDLLSRLSTWVWSTLASGTTALFQSVLLQPFQWKGMVTDVFGVSRDLAWAAAGLVIVMALLRSIWPMGMRPETHPEAVLRRVATGTLLLAAWLPMTGAMLSVNNALVRAFAGSIGGVSLGLAQSETPVANLLSPLLALALAVLVVVLVGYLTVFYALRAIEILVLAGLGPWLVVGWMAWGTDRWLLSYIREFGIAVFVQSVHALTLWLFVRMVSGYDGTFWGPLLAAGMLWYMAMVPHQLRRLLGAPAVTRG